MVPLKDASYGPKSSLMLSEPVDKHGPEVADTSAIFWHSDGSVNSIWHSFGTVEGQIGLVERHFRWEVLYNHCALHVGA